MVKRDDDWFDLPTVIVTIHPDSEMHTGRGVALEERGYLYTNNDNGNQRYCKINPGTAGLKDFLIETYKGLDTPRILNPDLFDLNQDRSHAKLYLKLRSEREQRKTPDGDNSLAGKHHVKYWEMRKMRLDKSKFDTKILKW